jgi:integration host factor subunit beta
MTKSELIEIIAAKQSQLSVKDVELAVKTLIEQMSETLAAGTPKTGESVGLAGKYVPHFKPGKELRDRVNEGLERDRVLGLVTDPAAKPTEDGTDRHLE